jgi:5'-phosphate synthase pdxT subunit
VSAPRIGVLALQGDVREHVAALTRVGAEPVEVRRPEELDGLDGIVLPGGESTTMGRLLDIFGMLEPLRGLLKTGLPAYGTCAGMILLAQEVVDGRPDQPLLGGLDISVRRNAFGSQVDSFEQDVDVEGVGPVHGVFIRAPWVERVGPDVEVLARVGEHPVAVRQGSVLATSFHPELTDDARLHEAFIRRIAGD